MNYDTTAFEGLDVHKDSITAACIGADPSEPPIDLGTIGTQQYAIDRLIKKVSGRGALQFVYEAGPCGFWLERYLRSKGERCLVAAPSLIPKRPGERIKTDRRDARNLALALRAGTLSAVHVPTADQEAFRDVVRAWQQSKRDITAAKQRLKAFLLRNDVRYSGRATWNAPHRRWLSELVMPSASQQIVYQELLAPSTSASAAATGSSNSSIPWRRFGMVIRLLRPCSRFAVFRRQLPTPSSPRRLIFLGSHIRAASWPGSDSCLASTAPGPLDDRDLSHAAATARRLQRLVSWHASTPL